MPDLLHGREKRVWGDAAYGGQTAQICAKAPFAADFTQRDSTRASDWSPEPMVGARAGASPPILVFSPSSRPLPSPLY